MKNAFHPTRNLAAMLALTLASVSSLACSSDDDEGNDPVNTVTEQEVIDNYAKNVAANYADALAGASELHSSVHEFTEAPSSKTLKAARDAWLASRDPYGLTEAFRFYDGPIDNPEDGPEGLINAWPIDENYIDYTVDEPEAGIINMPEDYPDITEDTISEANEMGGEANISTGYHAIEFLLWGQDQSDTGPGDRAFTDYVEGEDGTNANQDRRATYLLTAADLLVANLSSVSAQWKDGEDNYRADFVSAPVKDSLNKIMTGMASLAGAELAQERMNVAYEEKDQEDEHSCFSDNTLADLHNNATSVQNVLLGKYGSNDGPGLDDLVEAKDPQLAQDLRDQIQTAIDEIEAIEGPFDQAILGDDDAPGRTHIRNAVDSLKAFQNTSSLAATALGITLVFPD